MMGTSHLVFGAGAWMALGASANYTPGLAETAAVLIGALAPDLDHPNSRMGRIIPPLSRFIHRNGGGHRGMTHSFLIMIPMLWLSLWLWGKHQSQMQSGSGWWGWLFGGSQSESGLTPDGFLGVVMLAFVFGYLTHLVGDLLTRQGVKFLWPLPFVIRLTPFRADSSIVTGIAWMTLWTGLGLQVWIHTESTIGIPFPFG
ncbi:MAG: metal-dependent hydrolase [Marinospirillum sp.]|nr:metal-dependent hydrolase [Marinospirillum sp.]